MVVGKLPAMKRVRVGLLRLMDNVTVLPVQLGIRPLDIANNKNLPGS
jgi:hypothetical protein